MTECIQRLVDDFARIIGEVDATSPVAINVRSKQPYKPGIGPHTERQTVRLIAENLPENYRFELEVPYPESPRSKCDIVLSEPDAYSIEVKMLRLMGDNGKPNDNILMHILSPYPEHRSAVTDVAKLSTSSLPGSKAIVIYGYDYRDWPMEPAIEAFELLANQHERLGPRCVAEVRGLIHPVHTRAKVFGWEILDAG